MIELVSRRPDIAAGPLQGVNTRESELGTPVATGKINKARRCREAMPGPADHDVDECSRAAQVFGIGRIEPFLDGGHQKSAIGRTLGDDFLREFEATGERRAETQASYGDEVTSMGTTARCFARKASVRASRLKSKRAPKGAL